MCAMNFHTISLSLHRKQKRTAMNIVNCAEILAKEIHKGQKDIAGADFYEGHLYPIASLCYEKYTKVVALLHDVSEETQKTAKEIIALLDKVFVEKHSEHLTEKEVEILVSALDLFDKRNYNSREEYLEGFLKDRSASTLFVKMTELKHLADSIQSSDPTPEEEVMKERYLSEYYKLFGWYNDPSLW